MSNPVEWQDWGIYFGGTRMDVISFTKTTPEDYALEQAKKLYARNDITIKAVDQSVKPSETERAFDEWWDANYRKHPYWVSPESTARAVWFYLTKET